jgi:hypothetical protein
MALATWGSSDPLPHVPALPGFKAIPAPDEAVLVQLNRLPLAEVQARRQATFQDHSKRVAMMENCGLFHSPRMLVFFTPAAI